MSCKNSAKTEENLGYSHKILISDRNPDIILLIDEQSKDPLLPGLYKMQYEKTLFHKLRLSQGNFKTASLWKMTRSF
jgi:hypothetical protein